MSKFDQNLAEDCVCRASSKCTSNEKTNAPTSLWIKSEKTGESIAYRFQLKGPQYLLLSHPLSRFKRSEKYWVGYEDSKICTELGFVPLYNINLNKYTLLKLWGDQAKRMFSPRADPIPEEEYVYWKMSCNRGKLPELSSMNFILKQSADLVPYQGTGCNCFKRYFIFGFWCFPEKGFSDSTVVINNSDKIHFVLKASKSIYIPIESYVKEMDLGLEKQVPVEMITLWGLRKNVNDEYFLKPINDVVLTKGIGDTLKEEKSGGRFLLNGIVSEFRKRERRFPTLTSVALYEISNLDLIMSLIGLVVSQRYHSRDVISRVGRLEDIKNEAERVLRVLLNKVCLDRTFGDSIQDEFSLAITYLSPMIVTDNEEVFFMHPSVYIALLSTGFEYRVLKDPINLVNLLKILEMMPSKSNTELRASKEGYDLKKNGIIIEFILPSLRIALRQIRISKILKELPILSSNAETDGKSVRKSVLKKDRSKPIKHEPPIHFVTKNNKDLFQQLDDVERTIRETKRDN